MYKDEILRRIASLEEKIKSRDELIATLIEKNNSEKLRLSQLRLKLEAKISEEALQRAKARPKSPKNGKKKFAYLSLNDCENVGLYNKVVLFPVAKCNLHNCYLDFRDVHKRRCVMRMCSHMEWVDDKPTT